MWSFVSQNDIEKINSSTKGFGVVYFVFIIAEWQFNLLLWNNPGGSVSIELPAIQETSVRSLSQEYTMEKRMVTHASVPAWRIPWTEESDGLQSTGSLKSRTGLSDPPSLSLLIQQWNNKEKHENETTRETQRRKGEIADSPRPPRRWQRMGSEAQIEEEFFPWKGGVMEIRTCVDADKGLRDWVGRVEEGDRKEFRGVSVHKRADYLLSVRGERGTVWLQRGSRLFEISKWKDFLCYEAREMH